MQRERREANPAKLLEFQGLSLDWRSGGVLVLEEIRG
jgi:hypothetical protein